MFNKKQETIPNTLIRNKEEHIIRNNNQKCLISIYKIKI